MRTIVYAAASLALAACAATSPTSDSGRGYLAVSANDNKAVLVDGKTTVVPNAAPDTIAVIDLRASPPRLVAEIDTPASVVGPPTSVAIAPDESFALVTAAMKKATGDPGRQVPDSRVSVIDLTTKPPQVIGVVQAGAGAAGVSINRSGNLALVANRAEGSVSIFTITGKTLTPAGKVQLGNDNSGPSHVAITPDGKTALVTRDGDSKISVLAIEGTKVTYEKRDLNAGLRPYGLDICDPGNIAVVANIGIGQGDEDTISVIDLQAKPPRVIDTITVGQTPEGIACSPDGSRVAVVAMSGSNKAPSSPFYRKNGRVVLFAVDGKKLSKAAEADIGNWSQGVAFSPDGRTLLVQNMVQKDIQVFEMGVFGLRDTGQRSQRKGGPAGIRTAPK
jgi:DNA-binding beta-propeller fold protein YncE